VARPASFALASISGVLLALSFPGLGHPAFAWIALTPLLIALQTGSLWRAFGLGLTAGAIYFAGTLYWIARVMAVYGALPVWIAVLVNAALIAYLSLFPALFAVVVRRLVVAAGPTALLVAPVVWVATELGRTYLLTGFPWVLLGYSQAFTLPIAQFASILGVYGLSALVAAVSASLACAAVQRSYAPAAATFTILLLIAAWGAVRVGRAELTRLGEPVRVGLVQGNVDQAEKWDPARATSIFARHLALSEQAIDDGAELVVWPESSTPFTFERDQGAADAVRDLARESGVPILLGSDEVDRTESRYYNSAYLVRSDGMTGGVYRKMHLVPFGEYVPLRRLLFFAAPLVETVSDFSPGDSATVFTLNGHRLSTAICYEVVYQDLVRRMVVGGSELLTTITNDAWFGETTAPYQHFAQAALRAVENGRYLVRAANTGISGVVDPYGRVLTSTPIFEAAVVVGEARFLTGSTVYTRVGDALAYASVLATVVMLIVTRRRVRYR
jgi:apolipoprotein N-acyltransferase